MEMYDWESWLQLSTPFSGYFIGKNAEEAFMGELENETR